MKVVDTCQQILGPSAPAARISECTVVVNISYLTTDPADLPVGVVWMLPAGGVLKIFKEGHTESTELCHFEYFYAYDLTRLTC